MASESYPLHRLIFRNDAAKLTKLLEDKEMQKRIDEYDNHGNTPLHLALMLNRHNCFMALLKYNCDVFSRNNFGWNPLDEASLVGDLDAIDKISYRRWKEYVDALFKPGGFIDGWEKTTPNLYVKYRAKVKTTIPLLQKIGAKDIEKIYKKGKKIRVDTTIGGIEGTKIPKIIRKNLSLLYYCEKSYDLNKIYIVDHTDKKYQELFPNIPKWLLSNFLNSKLSSNSLYNFTIDLSKYNFKVSKGLLKKSTRTFAMENGKSYKCDKYRGRNACMITTKRKDEGFIDTCESIIQKEVKEETKKSKEGKGSSVKRSNTTAKSPTKEKDNKDDSDSDSEDSEEDSDAEENIEPTEEDNNDEPEPEPEEAQKSETSPIKESDSKFDVKNTLDWEKAFDNYQNNELIDDIMDKNEKSKLKILTEDEKKELNVKKLTEEEYFNPSNTNHLHMGRVMKITENRKVTNKIKVYTSKKDSNFPLNAYDIKPILEYIMTILFDQVTSREKGCELDKKAYDYITGEMLDEFYNNGVFPIKMSVPIHQAVVFQVTFLDVSKDESSVPDELFEIPKDYTPGEIFTDRRNKKK